MRRAGMSLVELVIALLLLSMVLVALAGAAALAQRSMATAATIERITREAAGVLDSLSTQPQPAGGARIVDGVALTWTVQPDSLGALLLVSAESHDGMVPVRLTFEARHGVR